MEDASRDAERNTPLWPTADGAEPIAVQCSIASPDTTGGLELVRIGRAGTARSRRGPIHQKIATTSNYVVADGFGVSSDIVMTERTGDTRSVCDAE